MTKRGWKNVRNKKKCQVAAAKEVGMGNPAEKNDRSPDKDYIRRSPTLIGKNFFQKNLEKCYAS